VILFSNLYRFSNFCSGLSSKELWHILGRSYAQIPTDLAIFAPAEVAAIDDITSGGAASAVGVWNVSNGVLFEHFTVWNPEWGRFAGPDRMQWNVDH